MKSYCSQFILELDQLYDRIMIDVTTRLSDVKVNGNDKTFLTLVHMIDDLRSDLERQRTELDGIYLLCMIAYS